MGVSHDCANEGTFGCSDRAQGYGVEFGDDERDAQHHLSERLVFLLEIYDRVIPSKSIPTFIGLCVIATVLYVGQAVLDLIRSRICNRLGDSLDATLSKRIYDAIIRLPLKKAGNGDSQQSIRDLDQVRSFLSSGGPLAFLDLPFMPLYLAICFLFHVWIGVACLFGMAVLIALAYWARSRPRLRPRQRSLWPLLATH
jgi:ATP-binding cassette, subfamily C, bacterial PrsD